MAPKKHVEGKTPAPTKKAQEKKIKEKKPLKPKLRIPTVIKVKIPIAGSLTVPNLSTKTTKAPKLTKKQALAQQKLDYANEAAASQLVKQKPIKSEPELVATEEPKVPKRKGRKKKIAEPVVTSADSEEAFEPTPAKKKCVRKVPVKNKPETKANKGKKFNLSLSPKKTACATKNTNDPEESTASNKASPTKAIDNETEPQKSKLNGETGKLHVEVIPSVNNGHSPSILTMEGKPDSSNEIVEACTIDSRKSSFNSELSWTRDISSSSTTTCFTVRSTDFVRIDKKLPILKLDDIGMKKIETYHNCNNDDSSSSSSSDSSDSESHVDNDDREGTPEVETRSLDLSTSSATPTKSLASLHSRENSNQNIINEEIDKTHKALDKLTAKLKKFDLEIINWIGYDNDDANINAKKFQGRIFQVLKEESEVISHCQRLKRVLSDNINNADDVNIDPIDNNIGYMNNLPDDVAENDQRDDANGKICSPKRPRPVDDENNFTSDKIKYKSFDQSCDDDDALSLFAESLTGMETSHNSCANSMGNAEFEEYVPQMVSTDRWEPAKKVSYTPTATTYIAEKPSQDVTLKAKSVCEKQTADSTSKNKDIEQERDFFNALFSRPPPRIPNPNTAVCNIRSPKLMSFYYKPAYGQKSNILKGVCFYNLLASCKKVACMYPHIVPDASDITAKLMRLSEEMFILEYILLRDRPELRRMYGMCFVEECRRRDLTRILVEMAKDFYMKAKLGVREDTILKVEVIECTLLHLNSVDLSLCDDLLMCATNNGTRLCDVFMQAIADTQNFSRFKPVFFKLTKFMLFYEWTFNLDVATQILERVSILPCERPLLEVLLDIVKHTDRRILDNSMMMLFEKQLVVHKDLHDQLVELKKVFQVSRPVLNSLYESSPRPKPVEPGMSGALVPAEREKRYTSPDTTNLDNMHKPAEETASPTIEFNRAGLFNIQRTFTNSSSNSDENRPKVVAKNKPNYKSWSTMSIFNSIRGQSPILRQASPRPGRGRPTMNFGQGPPSFPRRSGPDYY